MLDVLTFVVLGILLSAGLYAAFRLGALPGQLARQRGHPHADAINVAGWVGLLTLGLLWPRTDLGIHPPPGGIRG